MKNVILIFILFLAFNTNAQTITELKSAIASPDNALQAVHHYPRNIQDGECHNVPTTSITLEGETITIIEKWTDGRGSKSQTTLIGTLRGQVAEGSWESTYSSGKWNYNFTTGIGKWNKTNAPFNFGTFREFQKLEFRIVGRSELYDGFRPCN